MHLLAIVSGKSISHHLYHSGLQGEADRGVQCNRDKEDELSDGKHMSGRLQGR